MKDISKLKDYRKKFKRYYDIDFSNQYVIHHIDLNHSNNDISNLMILPKELHNRYHFYLNATLKCNDDKFKREISFDIRPTGCRIGYTSYEIDMFNGLINTIDECNMWYDYKMYLDGKLPNIHYIELN